MKLYYRDDAFRETAGAAERNHEDLTGNLPDAWKLEMPMRLSFVPKNGMIFSSRRSDPSSCGRQEIKQLAAYLDNAGIPYTRLGREFYTGAAQPPKGWLAKLKRLWVMR